MLLEIIIIVLLVGLGLFHFFAMRGVWSDIAELADILDQHEERIEKLVKLNRILKASISAANGVIREHTEKIAQLEKALAEHRREETNEGDTENKVETLERLWQKGLNNILNYSIDEARKAAADEDE